METPAKEKLGIELETSFQHLINWVNEQPEENFNKEMIPGKWTIAGHLYHLIKSTKGVSKGMGMPKLALRTMFGKNNRAERTSEELYAKYKDVLSGGAVVPGKEFTAEPGRIFERAKLINRFEDELKDLTKALGKWSETDMGVYIMPHPAIGKITIREFMYFTVFHTEHHLRTLKSGYSA